MEEVEHRRVEGVRVLSGRGRAQEGRGREGAEWKR